MRSQSGLVIIERDVFIYIPALAGGFFAVRATWETLNSFCQVNSRFGQKHFINEINAKELITHEYNSSPMHKILKYTHLMNYVSSHI